MFGGFAHYLQSNEGAISRGKNPICGPGLRHIGLQCPHNPISFVSHFTEWSTLTGLQAGHVIKAGYPNSGSNIHKSSN